MASQIPFYNALENNASDNAANDMESTIKGVSRTHFTTQSTSTNSNTSEVAVNLGITAQEEQETIPEIPPLATLLGIDSNIYTIINQALTAKRHLIFYGPPGTGKTTLAEYIATYIAADYLLVTGTSDWTSQDLIGGYQPIGEGKLEFVPGLLLENFDRPIIIDELNRVDIDKAIGPLFTVLSGQQTTLPYQLKLGSNDVINKRIQILPSITGSMAPHQYAPSSDWRIFATINTVDKASLYQMSYALSRRFAWILIDIPTNLQSFISDYLTLKNIPHVRSETCPIESIWESVNKVRVIGAAPIIDLINFCQNSKNDFNFFVSADADAIKVYLNGFFAFLLPMLDGMLVSQCKNIIDEIIKALSIPNNSPYEQLLRKHVELHAV